MDTEFNNELITSQLVDISHDGQFVDSQEVILAGSEERIPSRYTLMDNTVDIGGVHQADVRPPRLSETDDIITSMLVPTKRLVMPSMDNAGKQTGRHNLLPMIDFDDAETPESARNDDNEVQNQVLRKQPPPGPG